MASPRIVLLSDNAFWETYDPLSKPFHALSPALKQEVYDELTALDGVLRPALEARWGSPNAYWSVSDNWNAC